MTTREVPLDRMGEVIAEAAARLMSRRSERDLREATIRDGFAAAGVPITDGEVQDLAATAHAADAPQSPPPPGAPLSEEQIEALTDAQLAELDGQHSRVALGPKRPPQHWSEIPVRGDLRGRSFCFGYGKLQVLSALEGMEAPDGSKEVIPQWLVSITRFGRRGPQRPDDSDVARALRAFDMEGAEEDNHHPGSARHFFLPVDPKRRVGCECKATEAVVTEPDGYQWTNPTDPAECRECEAHRLGVAPPCRTHKTTVFK